MTKSTRPTARDLVFACRLAHEAAGVGDDPVAWRRHLLAGLQRRIGGGDEGTAQACVMPQPIRPDAIGLRLVVFSEITPQPVIGMLADYYAAGDLSSDPVTPAFVGQGPRSFVGFREQVCPDRRWYRSTYFNQWRRPMRQDDVLYSQVMVPGMACCSGLGFTRPIGSPRPFTRRQAAVVHVAHLEVGRMWRRGRAATPPLTPRLWQVLDATCRGLSAKQVARELGVAFTTAQDHIAQLNKRLGVSSRGELVRAGLALRRRRGPAVL